MATSARSKDGNSERLTLSREDSLASHSLRPEGAEARRMTAISGRKCYESYGKYTRLGLLAKMLLESSIWRSKTCVHRWKIRAMKSNRLLFQLAPSAPRTVETGFGLLRIPAVRDEHPSGTLGRSGRKNQIAFPHQIAILKTPSASDGQGGIMEIREDADGHYKLRDQIPHFTGGKETGLKLQPTFALWMMGYPVDWCDLEDGEMPRLKRQATQSSLKLPSK